MWYENDSDLLDLFYDIRLNTAVAIFQIFATQMLGYGFAGICRLFLQQLIVELRLTGISENSSCLSNLVCITTCSVSRD